jgi:hypothetical protein
VKASWAPTFSCPPASSIAQRVLERLDAELSNNDDIERSVMARKVAVVAMVGNEDGAHKTIADMFVDYKDLDDVPEPVPRPPRPPPAMRLTSQAFCGVRSIRPTETSRFRDGFSHNGPG